MSTHFIRGRAVIALSLICLVLPSFAGAQQTGTIRGRVTESASGAPVSSALVTVVGTSVGTVTDANGGFTIVDVPAGSQTVQARRIGFTPERRPIRIAAGGSETLNFILLPAATSLERVVVTGTAAPTTARALGTSIATVGGEEVAESRAMTVDAALQGKVAGAQITQNSGNPGGGGLSVRLRGTGSITSGSEPLYIIDGVIVDNSSDQLVDLGARSNVQNRLADINPNDIDRIEIVRGAAAAALYGSRANNGVVQIFTKHGRVAPPRLIAETRYSGERLAKRLDLNLSPVDATGKAVTRYDYQDYIFEPGNLKETSLAVDGGDAKTTYYAGGSYTNEQGIMRKSASLRKTARLNLSEQLFPKLRLNFGGNFVNTKNNFEPNGEQTQGVITAVLFSPTTFSFFPVNGVYPAAPTGAEFANPLEVIERWKAPQTINRFIGSANAMFTPASNVVMQYTLGYDGYSLEADQFIPRGSLPGVNVTGYSAAIVRDSRIVNNDAVATLTSHPARALEAGTSVGVNFTTQFIQTTTAVARDLLPTGELVSAGASPAVGQSRFNLATLGYYVQQSLAWRDRLYLTGAVRRDASSTFGSGDRWQTYPKLSLSYVISDESYYKNSFLGSIVPSLRLRSALGYAGNQPSLANAYARYDSYVKAVNNDRIGTVNSTALGNDSLRPERQREVEFGGDLGFLRDRLNFELTFYNKRVSDALLSRPQAPSTGYTTQLANIGEISNRGVELLARALLMDGRAVRWNSTVTYSRNRNRVDKLIGAPFTLGYANRVQQGEPLGFFFAELPQKNAAGEDSIDAAGLIVRSPTATRVSTKVGDPNPDWIGSLLNEVDIGSRLHFRALLDGSFGGEVLNFTRRIMDTFGTSADVAREYLPVGDPNRLAPGYLRSKRFYFGKYAEDGSFVKLRELSLTYNLTPFFANVIRAKGLDLTVSGRNLHTWTSYSGYDPEMNLFGQRTVERGNDFGTYPIPRVWSIGVRATY